MKHKIKDLLAFSRAEKRGILVLIILIIIVLSVGALLPRFIDANRVNPAEFKLAIAKWEISRKKIEIKKLEAKKNKKKKYSPKKKIKPIVFNPNNLPKEKWIEMGFSEAEAQMIKNYEAKGGKFYKKEDVKKLYCISDTEYEILAPFIRIPKNKNRNKKSTPTTVKKDTVFKKNFKKTIPIIVEINSADTAQLESLRGVGPAFARRIIKYRNKLGGFYSPEQLMEVYGLDSLRYSGFVNQLRIDTNLIEKIDINKVEFKQLLKHPYVEYYVVKSIFAYKNENGGFSSVSELKNVKLIYNDLYKRLSPYFIVSEPQK